MALGYRLASSYGFRAVRRVGSLDANNLGRASCSLAVWTVHNTDLPSYVVAEIATRFSCSTALDVDRAATR